MLQEVSADLKVSVEGPLTLLHLVSHRDHAIETNVALRSSVYHSLFRYLRVSINAIHTSTSVRVPKLDATVCGSTTRGEQVALERTPCQCLHSSLMVIKPVEIGAGALR